MALMRSTTDKGAAPRRWAFYYDGDCGFCIRVVRWLARLDWLRQVTWTAYQSLEQLPQGLSREDLDRAAYLEDTRRQRRFRGFYAFRRLTLRLPPLLPLAPLFWFPGVDLVGRAVYRWVAANRQRISRCRAPGRRSGG
jgi:predicted DCC family thiol-disulfide oxidoreductase YuxK